VAKTIRSSGHEALRGALIAARKNAALTQEELAGRLRCHQSFVARVESGERRIDVIELIVLARALEVDASQLFSVAEGATEPEHRI
jgi:transcriptional regulator with XRE-family HTH domain